MADLLTFPPTIPDAAERARALDITRSWIVEAPAGSGKTGLLIQRLLKLLATVDDPSQVLAITFTRKATAELRDRVLAQLAAASANTPTQNAFDQATRPYAQAVLLRDTQLAWNLLDTPSRLNIRTIDSVSNDIASALPVLSGAGGGLAPEEDAATLYASAARRTVMQLGGPDPAFNAALQSVLLHRDGDLAGCESLIAAMLATRDQWAELVPLTPAHLDDAYLEQTVLPKLERTLDLIICRALTAVTKALPPAFLDDLCTLAADMGHAAGYNNNPSPLAFCAGNRIPPAEKAAHLDHWIALVDLLLTKTGDFRNPRGLTRQFLRFEIRPDHKLELVRVLDAVRDDETLCELLCSIRTLPPPRYPPDQWQVTKALFRVLSRALVELQLVFAARAACDFPEIAALARAALRSSALNELDELGLASGSHLQHLLVDEMQDTSSSQYELIQLLTQSWDGGSRTVFLVGDPRQSIYLFRQARVERFVQTMLSATLGASPDPIPLGVLHLTANFRSQPALVQAFNEDFSLIFPPHEQIPYQPAHPTRPPTDRQPHSPQTRVPHLDYPQTRVPHLSDGLIVAKVGHRASDPSLPSLTWYPTPLPNNPADKPALRRTQAQAEAKEIHRIVAHWLQKPLPPDRTAPWKIAVLVQARTHLLHIVKAFKDPAAPVPYRAVKIEPLAERQEILDLLALTRALLHPADRIAWLALLRTPWCGLTLADLHLLAGQDDPALSRHTILDLLEQRGDLLSEDAIARLQPFWTVMRAALAQRDRIPLSQLVSRTWHAFRAPAFASQEELRNVESYLLLLDTLETSTGTLSIPALTTRLAKLYAAPSVQPGAVDLMTIHNAKGLEWDVVIVPALHRVGRSTQGRLLAWLEIEPEAHPSAEPIAPGILAPIRAKGSAADKLNAWINSVDKARNTAERKRLFYVACTRAREELHLFASPETRATGEPSIPPQSLLAAAWPAAQRHFAAAPPAAAAPAPPLQVPSPQTTPTFAIAATAAPPPPRQIHRIPTSSFPHTPGAPSQTASPSEVGSKGLTPPTLSPNDLTPDTPGAPGSGASLTAPTLGFQPLILGDPPLTPGAPGSGASLSAPTLGFQPLILGDPPLTPGAPGSGASLSAPTLGFQPLILGDPPLTPGAPGSGASLTAPTLGFQPLILGDPPLTPGAPGSGASLTAPTLGFQPLILGDPPLTPGAPGSGASLTAPTLGFQPTTFPRSEGSFSARSFGNTLHAFLQQLATGPTDIPRLREELQTWTPRIAAVLRSSGLPPAEIDRLTRSVLRGLLNTLDSPEGQWLLAPHPQAATEAALTSSLPDEAPSTVRLDRTFLAGPTPLTIASTHLWIVDYKTATHAHEGLEAFLEDEQRKYRPQLETYARRLSAQPLPIRLALFYPMLPSLVWWSPTGRT